MPIHVRLPFPHAGQQAVRRYKRRFNILSAGRRWRKTTHCMSEAIEAAVQGATIVWGAPTYDQVYTGYEEAAKAAGKAARTLDGRLVEFKAAGRILYRSLDDPDNARSKTADGVVLDECGEIAGRAWYEVVLPMLLDTGGWAWLVGTPKGKTWFYNEYVAATDPGRPKPDTAAWQIPTLGVEITQAGLVRKPHPLENPDIRFEEIVAMYDRMSEMAFRQEILAEFIDDAGGFLHGVRACVRHKLPIAPYSGTFVMGVDLGKSHDFTVIVLIDVKARKVVAVERFNNMDWPTQRKRIVSFYDQWRSADAHVTVVVEENNFGGPIIDEIRRGDRAAGLRPLPVVAFVTTNDSKVEIFEHLRLLIETQALDLPDLPWFVNELQALQATRTATNRLRLSAPEGLHDDGAMALAIAAKNLEVRRPRPGAPETSLADAIVTGEHELSGLSGL